MATHLRTAGDSIADGANRVNRVDWGTLPEVTRRRGRVGASAAGTEGREPDWMLAVPTRTLPPDRPGEAAGPIRLSRSAAGERLDASPRNQPEDRGGLGPACSAGAAAGSGPPAPGSLPLRASSDPHRARSSEGADSSAVMAGSNGTFTRQASCGAAFKPDPRLLRYDRASARRGGRRRRGTEEGPPVPPRQLNALYGEPLARRRGFPPLRTGGSDLLADTALA